MAILQSKIKILEIKAVVESKSLLNPEQLKHLNLPIERGSLN
jgi:hypothetical protein